MHAPLIAPASETGPEPVNHGRPAHGPHHQAVPVIAELQERAFQPADLEPLRRPGGHPEDDLPHLALHGVTLSRGGDPEVLAHRRARAGHRFQDDAPLRVHHELLGDRPVVHRVVRGHRERLSLAKPDARRLTPRAVLQFEHRHGAQRRSSRERGRAATGDASVRPPARRDHLGLRPFSAKYLVAPGWNGMGEPPSYWLARSRLAASEWTAARSAFFSNRVFTMSWTSFSSIPSCTTRTFHTSATWASWSCLGLD